jgi:hypothetical protein
VHGKRLHQAQVEPEAGVAKEVQKNAPLVFPIVAAPVAIADATMNLHVSSIAVSQT